MKKIIVSLAVLLLFAVPALAGVTITATQISGTEVEVSFTNTDQATNPVRAVAIDIVLDDANIVSIDPNMTGESIAVNPGYGVFPASFSRVIDPENPNWDNSAYTPAALLEDLPSDTQPGLGTHGVTVEMGSLYVGGPNKPIEGPLFTFTIDNDCNIVQMEENVSRGGVLLEDGSPGTTFILGGKIVYCPPIQLGQEHLNWIAVGRPKCWCCKYQEGGDLNGDGYTNPTDVMTVLRPAYPSSYPTAPYDHRADMNHDGFVNPQDVMLYMRPNYPTQWEQGYNCPWKLDVGPN